MAVQPTIILVHGFWGGAAHGARSSSSWLGSDRSDPRAVENPLTSLADDIARTRR